MNRYDSTLPDSAGDSSRLDEQQVLQLVDAELSPRARLRTTALLVFALATTAIAIALSVTEPSLLVRTRIAFGLVSAAGLAWSVHLGHTLLHRRTPYVLHRIASATLAIGVGTVFLLAALLLAWLDPTQRALALTAALLTAPLPALAIVLRVRAVRHLRRLRARRDALAGDGP
jgi:hypothetical protein